MKTRHLIPVVACHVVILTGVWQFGSQRRLSNAIYDRLSAHALRVPMTDEQRLLALMQTTHTIQRMNKTVFTPKIPWDDHLPLWPPSGSGYMRDPSQHLLTPGACGSFTLALGKILERSGIEFRIAQMICQGTMPGCHILLEAKLANRWVALDPLHNLAFRRPDGKLASYADVSADWEHYQAQIPDELLHADPNTENHYDPAVYDYRGVRYTNWEKVPVIMPAARWLLELVFGEDVISTLSIRPYVLDQNRVFLILLAIAYGALALLTVYLWRRERKSGGGASS